MSADRRAVLQEVATELERRASMSHQRAMACVSEGRVARGLEHAQAARALLSASEWAATEMLEDKT